MRPLAPHQTQRYRRFTYAAHEHQQRFYGATSPTLIVQAIENTPQPPSPQMVIVILFGSCILDHAPPGSSWSVGDPPTQQPWLGNAAGRWSRVPYAVDGGSCCGRVARLRRWSELWVWLGLPLPQRSARFVLSLPTCVSSFETAVRGEKAVSLFFSRE